MTLAIFVSLATGAAYSALKEERNDGLGGVFDSGCCDGSQCQVDGPCYSNESCLSLYCEPHSANGLKGHTCGEGTCKHHPEGRPFYGRGGSEHVFIPRKVMDKSPGEILYTYPASELNSKAISVNGDSVTFQYYEMAHGAYTWDMDNVGLGHETGVFNHAWGKNLISIFGKSVVVGGAEKYHTLKRDGPWIHHSKDLNDAERNKQNFIIKGEASAVRMTRDNLVNAFMAKNKMASQAVDAGLDVVLMSQNQKYAAESTDTSVTDRMENPDKLRGAIKEIFDKYKSGSNTDIIKSDNNCIHFEKTDDMIIGETSATFPIGKTLVVYKGHVSFTPFRRFGILLGNGMFEMTATGQLEFHFRAASFWHLGTDDPDGAVTTGIPTTFWISPVDGKSSQTTKYPVANYDSRVKPMAPSSLAKVLYGLYYNIPQDYYRFYEDPDKLCPIPGEAFDKMKKHFHDFSKDGDYSRRRASPETNRLNLLAANEQWEDVVEHDMLMDVMDEGKERSIADQAGVLRTFAESIDCGSTYLRSSSNSLKDSHGFDPLEATVWDHFLLEYTTPENGPEFVAKRDWDEVPFNKNTVFEKQSAGARTTTSELLRLLRALEARI